MAEILDAALSWPTLPWSVLLGLVSLYWATVIFGILDLDILDGIGDALGGLGEGAAEGLAEGLGEGLADGIADGAGDALDADGSHGGGLLHNLGLGGVPLTLSLSLVIFFVWVFSAGGTVAAGRALSRESAGGVLVPIGVALGALVLGVLAAAISLVPFRRLLEAEPSTTRADLVGRLCRIRTGHVDESFGQALVVHDGVDLLVQVRAPEPNPFRAGSSALIYTYDPHREVFLVTEADDSLVPDDDAPRS